MMSEGMLQSLIGGFFAVICVVVGAGITGIGNYRDRLRKRREDKNKTVFCLLSLYFYVSHLCADNPLQKVVESCFDDVRRECGIKDTDFLEDELKKILSPTQYTSVQKYLSNGIDELKQHLKDAVDRLSARNPILAYSLEAKLNVLSMMDLAENYVAEGIKKYSAFVQWHNPARKRTKVSKFSDIYKHKIKKRIFLSKNLSVSEKCSNFARFFVGRAFVLLFADWQKIGGASYQVPRH